MLQYLFPTSQRHGNDGNDTAGALVGAGDAWKHRVGTELRGLEGVTTPWIPWIPWIPDINGWKVTPKKIDGLEEVAPPMINMAICWYKYGD